MANQNISMRQMMTLLLLALFSLGAERLPRLSGAGAALWLAPLLALPLVLWGIFLAFRGPRPETRLDLAEGLTEVLGSFCARLLSFLFLLWGFVLLVLGVTRCAARLGTADGSPLIFAALVMGLAVLMAAKPLPAMVRACEIFYLIMAVAILGVLLMAAPRVEPGYVFLVTKAELVHLPATLAALLGTFSVGLYALFLSGSVTVRERDATMCYRKASLLFVSLSALLLLILGSFGAPLVAKLQKPFFQMVAALGVQGAFQRLEALFSALWMLGDLALFTLLLFAMKRLASAVTKKQESAWLPVGAGALALVGGGLLSGRETLLQWGSQSLLPLGGLVFGALVLLLFFAVKYKQGRKTAEAPKESG